jgi:DNA invertase Pin-like site-specific DNA recombinase
MPKWVYLNWHCTSPRIAPAPSGPSIIGGIGVIACYCRVSSAGQKNDSQKPEIRRWLDGNRIDLSTVGWFEDKESGKSMKRPAFDRLQKAIFAGTVTTVVVWKLDRISRGQRDGVNVLADWCERGVRVVAVTQQIDLSGPVGRLVASVLFGLAEIETEYRRERQAAGIAEAKQRGAYRGRDQGTTKAPASRALELRARGLTVQEIATALGVSRRTAFRYLAMASAS